MRFITSVLLVSLLCALTEAREENEVEARGKKKIILFIYFLDLVVKKIFVFKVIYAIAFWLLLHKAGYFFGWFVSYLKEQKHAYVEHPPHHHHYEEYGPPGPYRRKSQKLYISYNPYSAPEKAVHMY